MKEDERRNQKPLRSCGIYYIKTMETYYVSCKKNAGNKMLELNCSIFGKKKSSILKIKERAEYWANSQLELH